MLKYVYYSADNSDANVVKVGKSYVEDEASCICTSFFLLSFADK